MHMSANPLSPNYLKEPTPYSIRATINPKVLNGIKDYLTAANADCLDEAERNFNVKADKISPILREFANYRLNRADYCFNLDPVELEMGCSAKQLFDLIRQGHIPRHFQLAKEYCKKSKKMRPYEHDFRLESKSGVISFYLKHAQLLDRFGDCPDLENARELLRFEMKHFYPKIYAMSKPIKNRVQKEMLESESPEAVWNDIFNGDIVNPTMELLSDVTSESVVQTYFNKVVRKGDYFTLDGARWMVKAHNFRNDKEERLLFVLEQVSKYRGIPNAMKKMSGVDLADFKRSLKDLDKIFVNPVTIPRDWGIPHIPNPLKAYYEKMYETRLLTRSEYQFEKLLKEYLHG